MLSGDTLTSIASAFATAINANSNLQSIGLSASSSSNLITIQSNSTNLTTYRQTVNNGATEQIILNVPANGTQTAVVGGSKTTGDVLTISIFDDGLSGGSVSINYAVLSGDTLTSIASALAAASMTILIWQQQLNMPVTSITKEMIQSRHSELTRTTKQGSSGEVQANMAMRILRTLLNFAANNYETPDGQPIVTLNPVRRLSQNRSWHLEPRRRVILPDNKLGESMRESHHDYGPRFLPHHL